MADATAWSMIGFSVWSSPAGNEAPMESFSRASSSGLASSTNANTANATMMSGTSARTLK